MTKRLSDFTIMSDVDGTLVLESETVPARNVEALRRFTEKGGHFGIATGRSRELTQPIVDQLPVNATCVLYNGGALYNYVTGRFIMQIYLPDAARRYVRELQDRFAGIGVMVVSNSRYFNVSEELAFAKYRRLSGDPVDIDSLTDPWYKVLFLVPADEHEAFLAYAQNRYEGVRFVATNSMLVEMLPENSSKGQALEELVRLEGLQRENLVVIGDFYNDLEMIRYAGIGVTLSDAPALLRETADLVVGTCRDGAVADLVEYLEAHYPA